MSAEPELPESVSTEPEHPVVARVGGSSNPVIVRTLSEILTRLSVQEFFSPDPSAPDIKARLQRRDLFLLAFAIIKDRDPNDPLSFFQLAGIHGQPFIPWDGVLGRKPDGSHWLGYCNHGSVLFPTWHRPYVALMEQVIIDAAVKLVKDSKGSADDVKVAESIRFPYWDTLSLQTLNNGVPSIFLDSTVQVSYPSTQTIQNPLVSFTFPNQSFPEFDTQKLGSTTTRNPDANGKTNNSELQANVKKNVSKSQSLLLVMFGYNVWYNFSNHNAEAGGQHLPSLEWIHDQLHGAVGGEDGEMSYPDYAAFDPIFWFHHCNVDRLLALWQFCHDKTWIKPSAAIAGTFTELSGYIEDEKSDLKPFRDSATTFWTSEKARDLKPFGYTYPDLEKAKASNWSATQMREYLNSIYAPSGPRVRTLLSIPSIPKNAFNTHFKVRAFQGLTEEQALTAPLKDPHHVGDVFIFSRGKEAKCENCKRQEEEGKDNVRGAIDITHHAIHSEEFTPFHFARSNKDLRAPATATGFVAVAETPDGQRFQLPGLSASLQVLQLIPTAIEAD